MEEEKYQKILQIWNTNLEKELPFKDIANELVYNHKRYVLEKGNKTNPKNSILR